MTNTMSYTNMCLAELYQAFKVQDQLYLDALRTKADSEIIKEIGREMDVILEAIKQRLAERTSRFHDNNSPAFP